MSSLNHVRSGSGEPLILIHGTGSRLQVWDPVVPALRNHFDVVAVDLPGFGQTPASGAGTVGSLTGAVADFADELGLQRPHVAGNSVGGSIALELAARGVARSATAFSPTAFWSTSGNLWFQAAMRGVHGLGTALRPALPALLGNRVGRTALFGLFVGKPWHLDPRTAHEDATGVLDAAGFAALMRSLRTYSARTGVADVPVTIAWGARDHLLTYRTQSRRARAALPNANHTTLARCGHIPFYDDPEQCVATILATASWKATS